MNAVLQAGEPLPHRPLDQKARELQAHLLERVSRTFALTIPRLPFELADPVGNAYLLCRIVDTIEDELPIADDDKDRLYARFNACLSDSALGAIRPGDELAADIARLLPQDAPAGEIELARLIPDVLRVTAGLASEQQRAMRTCLSIMTSGMHRFESLGSDARGLADTETLESYCYHVAGCVGEMLTELFCLHDAAVAARRDVLMPLSVRFGYGLQLTNILKDMWADHARGVCWLPRDAFDLDAYRIDASNAASQLSEHGLFAGAPTPSLPRVMQLALDGDRAAIRIVDDGTRRLLGRCRAYLDDAMRYVRTLPAEQLGMRVFCLWSIGLAVLTLRRIHRLRIRERRLGTKIARRSVRATLLFSDASASHERIMMFLYGSACIGLPPARD